MKHHDNEATIYVCSLGPEEVTRPQKQCLLRIANCWSARFRATHIPSADLCQDLMIGERQLGRICQALHDKGIVEYIPGRGAGNWSQFRFPKLDTKATETRHKGDIFDTPNKERNLNQDLDQNLNQNPAGFDFDVEPRDSRENFLPVSSSETKLDDDTSETFTPDFPNG